MEYKEQYHALRAQHSALQRQFHERTEELKRTNVQASPPLNGRQRECVERAKDKYTTRKRVLGRNVCAF